MHLLKHLLIAGIGFTGFAGAAAAHPATPPAGLSATSATSDTSDTSDISAASVSAATVKYRKNIDELTTEELAAYEHAVTMMKKKSAANIFDRTGFLWQAWVHNCTAVTVNQERKLPVDDISTLESCAVPVTPASGATHKEHPGMCEHAKDTFFQWHRAQFYFYEKALQSADPDGKFGPSTKNVTVPYWNFTKKPSGKRYPKVYENPNSPLYSAKRNAEPLSGPYAYTSPYLLAYLIYYNDWQTFGGYPVGGAGNYGSFEGQIHNPMHAEYVGGYLKYPPTAGLDPVFYAFHSFIDYIFEKWIEEHGTDTITGGNLFMRGEQDDDVQKPAGFSEGTGSKRPGGPYTKNMGRGELYYDTKKLGYAYQPSSFGEFIPKATLQAMIDKHRKSGFVFGDQQSLFSELLSFGGRGPVAAPKATFGGKTTIPTVSFGARKATLDIVRSADSPDYSFQTDVYLHPVNVEANIGRKDFRDRYLVVSTSYWALGGHDHSAGAGASATMSPLTVTQDVTDVINSLRRGGKAGQDWKITMAVTGDGYSGNYQFSAPVINIK